MEKSNQAVHTKFWQTSDFLAAFCITIGFWIEMEIETTLGLPLNILLGIIIWLIGLAVVFLAKHEFKKFEQMSGLGYVTDKLVTTGIFSYSRNPIYIGVVIIVMGFGVLFDSWWLLGSSLLTLILLHFVLVVPEEKFLAEAFGEEFETYKKHVRRWF